MSRHAKREALALLGVAALLAACASEPPPAVVTTTSADVVSENTAVQVAKARCQRAAECNRVGADQMYADKDECIQRERSAAYSMAATCTQGVSKDGVDKCVANLAEQFCDANLGAVTAMPECRSYCRH